MNRKYDLDNKDDLSMVEWAIERFDITDEDEIQDLCLYFLIKREDILNTFSKPLERNQRLQNLLIQECNRIIKDRNKKSDKYSYYDNHYYICDLIESDLMVDAVRFAINRTGLLSKREILIIERYFGLNGFSPKSLEEIALEYNVTKERIRQIKDKALRKISFKNYRYLRDYI